MAFRVRALFSFSGFSFLFSFSFSLIAPRILRRRCELVRKTGDDTTPRERSSFRSLLGPRQYHCIIDALRSEITDFFFRSASSYRLRSCYFIFILRCFLFFAKTHFCQRRRRTSLYFTQGHASYFCGFFFLGKTITWFKTIISSGR